MRLLDLFCGAGGAAMGYHRAGFDEIVGVDIKPQPHYPFEFKQRNALEVLWDHADELHKRFDMVHASPPCQGYMQGSTATGDRYPQLIHTVRKFLQSSGVPYVIENITQARPHLVNPSQLCGEMFGLGVIRHRLFETSFELEAPQHVPHRGRVRGWRHGVYADGPYVAVYGKGGGKATETEAREAMGIDWMDLSELREAIPPAYTTFIGKAFAKALEKAA